MVPTDTPFILSHTVRLSPGDVLDALRQAALSQVHGMLGAVEPVAGGVELDTRVLPNGTVEIDGAAVTITAKLPQQILAMLRDAISSPGSSPGATAAPAPVPHPGWLAPN
jgi:hypothetical protein